MKDNDFELNTDIVLENIYKGDIIWAKISNAIGSVQQNLRPYIVVSNNRCNKYSPTITCVPLTTQVKKCLPTHHIIYLNGKRNTVLCEQITCIDKTQISSIVGTVDDEDFKAIDKKLKIQLNLL